MHSQLQAMQKRPNDPTFSPKTSILLLVITIRKLRSG